MTEKIPPGYEYYQTFDVKVHVTYEKNYKIRAMNDDHAFALAKDRLKKRNKSTKRKGLSFVDAVSVNTKRICEDENGTS
jgi:hypothetical protein|tara:strand:- start:1513 stop:1749 length:237 start_codon:yes stop_codon:yes gene_type:complete